MVTRSKNTSFKRAKTSTAKPATAAATSTNGSATSNRETLRKLYLSLLKCRFVAERLQRAPNPRLYEFVIGEEAVAAGAVADLNAEDTLAASPRDLAALVAGGKGVEELLHAHRKETHSSKRGLSGAPSLNGSPATGLLSLSSLSDDPFTLGTGLALAHKLARKQYVVVAISREVPSLEPWREAFRMAVAQKLPIVYILKNGVASESEHAPHLKPVSFMAREGGLPGIIVDGQDVVAVWRVVQESIHRARNRGGPTLIDCRTEPGRDPLANLEHYMRKRGLWDDGWCSAIEKQIRADIDALIE